MGLVQVGDDLGGHGPPLAATQFLGMISNALFWPGPLLPDRRVDDDRVDLVVAEAVRTTAARYAVRA